MDGSEPEAVHNSAARAADYIQRGLSLWVYMESLWRAPSDALLEYASYCMENVVPAAEYWREQKHLTIIGANNNTQHLLWILLWVLITLVPWCVPPSNAKVPETRMERNLWPCNNAQSLRNQSRFERENTFARDAKNLIYELINSAAWSPQLYGVTGCARNIRAGASL